MKTKKITANALRTTNASERDLYQMVTDRVIEAIEKGVAPWKRPWRSVRTLSGDPVMPVNALTHSTYRGINVLLLWLAAEEAGYSTNRWLTYRQAQALGGQVRKGEKSTMAVIYKSWHKQDEDENGNRIFDAEGNPVMVDVPVLKANPLFNVEQCDGLSLPEAETTTVTENGANDTLNALTDRVLRMVNACGVKIHSLPQNRAYYTPVFDRIVLPHTSQFASEEDYWSTLLHELVHSTGHAKRLNREGIVSTDVKSGDERYAFEELIAEMGSAFLCAQLGVTGNVQHENYIGAWLKILRADKKALFSACRQAREATEYLLSEHDSPVANAA